MRRLVVSEGAARRQPPIVAGMLRLCSRLCQTSRLMLTEPTSADVLTSARMAAGMTSRARRPDLPLLAG
jgi:hypothetical protein